jgi:hypothetical protein
VHLTKRGVSLANHSKDFPNIFTGLLKTSHIFFTIQFSTLEIVPLEGELMKNLAAHSITALALVTGLGISIPAVAGADSGTTTTTTPSAWTTWHASWVSYVNGLKAIRADYRASVETARATFETSLTAATNKTERQTARATLDATLATDINARVAAITAAGDPPAPPAGYNGSAFVAGVQAANVAFRASATAAQSVLATALADATTSAARHTARLNYQVAVGNAMVVRSTALLALGVAPSHPGKTA